MKILGIDSSTDRLSVGLCRDGKIISDRSIDSLREHGSRIMGLIDSTLKGSKIEVIALDGVAVAVGPGSFTGLRVGMAAAKGLAQALNIPIVGISTFEVVAHRLLNEVDEFVLVEQARKGEFYFCHMDIESDILSNMKLVALENLGVKVENLPVGLIGVAADWPIESNQTIHSEKTKVSGAELAILGEEKILNGRADDLAQLEPLYIAPSQAEIKYGRTKSSN
ncbi:MAG: tRNA (adenosine(37)-N6)-threonylcarbamoyltransferase complex dimerization subunit type 1 TsaB [candidate division Zixibacteria bacterium]